MSRIRSVHPGIWTDEDFVSLSIPARLFCIGLWGEADDYGVFEWKPLRLKMRLAPVDDIDAAVLLSELTRNKQIVSIWRGDKQYGAIKNFRKFQRPKNPSAPLIPMDQEINSIVGLPAGDIPPPALPQDEPGPAVIRPQMEDGGDKDDGDSANEREHITVTRKMLALMGVTLDDMKWFGSMARVEMWLARGWSAENLIYPAVTKMMLHRGSQGPPNGIGYIEKAIESYALQLAKPLPEIANVNGTRTQNAGRPTLDDQFAELDRLCAAGPGSLEPFGDTAGGIIIDQPGQRH
jgi:hypothetical protein